nr:MAG TPA: tubulin [Caudoviricetes sp.]
MYYVRSKDDRRFYFSSLDRKQLWSKLYMSKGTIRIYACGGMACNLATSYYGLPSANGFADIKTCFIDTSRSNMIRSDKEIAEDDIFILGGAGAGKVKRTSYEELNNQIGSIIQKFKPEDVNIVMFSLSGGTGSTGGPLIVKDLLEKGQTVMCVVVGSEEAKITIDNTIKTLKSLDNISRKARRPIVLSFSHNSATESRLENDQRMTGVISAVSILSSRENKELDIEDLNNFFDTSNVSRVGEGLSFLYIANDEQKASEIKFPIATASLMVDEGKVPTLLNPEYACVGYPAKEVLKGELHFILSQHELETIFKRLNERLAVYEGEAASRPNVKPLGGDTASEDDGMVL